MKKELFSISAIFLLLSATFAEARPAAVSVARVEPDPAVAFYQPSVKLNGLFSVNKAPKGKSFQGAVVLEIPNGYHINSNRPTNKFMIPTAVRVTGPRGVRIGRVTYPRAIVRSFEFAPNERLPVFEGRPAVRFNVTVPESFKQEKLRLRVEVSYQACSDTACYRPDSRDVTLSINVAEPDDEIEQINKNVFGGGKRRKK